MTERSRLAMVETAITWSGSVEWRMPRNKPSSTITHEGRQCAVREEVGGGVVLISARPAMLRPRTSMNVAESEREPALDERPVSLPTRKKPPGVDHHQSAGNEDGREAEAEGNDEKQSKTDTMETQRAEQDDQRRWTGDDAAGDSEAEELSEGHLHEEAFRRAHPSAPRKKIRLRLRPLRFDRPDLARSAERTEPMAVAGAGSVACSPVSPVQARTSKSRQPRR